MSDFYYKIDDAELHLTNNGGIPAEKDEEGYWPWTGNADITKVIIDGPIQLPSDSSRLFEELYNLTEIDGLDKLDTSQVTNMYMMFDACYNLVNLDLSSFDTSNVTDMSSMFSECHALKGLNGFSSLDLTSVIDLSRMFAFCQSLEHINFSDTPDCSPKDIMGLFENCINLTEIDGLDNLDTSQVTDMRYVFYQCHKLAHLNGIENWDVSNVTDMSEMFAACWSLSLPDMSKWQPSPYNISNCMFYGVPSCTLSTSSQSLISAARAVSCIGINVIKQPVATPQER